MIYGAKHSPPSSAQRGPKGKIKVSTQKCSKSTSNASFQQSMVPQFKMEMVNFGIYSLKRGISIFSPLYSFLSEDPFLCH